MPVYQYQGQHYDLPDGLTNEQAIAKIKSHLGGSSTPAELGIPDSTPMPGSGPVPEPSFGEKVLGAGEAGLNLLGSIPGMVAGPIMGLQAATRGASVPEAEKVAAQTMENMQLYTPKTEAGKEAAAGLGEFMNRYVIPVAPMLHTLPAIKAGEAKNALQARFTKPEAVKPPSAIEAAKAALNAKEEVVPTSEGGQGAFQNIADRLGFQEGENTPLRTKTPTEDMATQLTKAGEESRNTAVQETLDWRQEALEQEVKQRVAREQEAKLRGEQEKAPVYSEEHKAWEQEKAQHESQVRQEQLHQEELTKAHQEALAEQQRIAEAQRALEERQAALEKDMQKAGDESKVRRSLLETSQTRQDLASRSPFSKAHLADQAAKKAAEEAKQKAADIAERRAANEAQIQKLREDHAASQERQAKAQQVIDQRTEQMRLDTAKQTSLDLGAAERTRQETGAPVPTDAFPLKPAPLGSKARRAAVGRLKKQGGFINLGAFRPSLKGPVGEILKDIGNALIKTPADAIKFAGTVGDVSQNTLQKAVNAFTKGGTYLKAKVNNPVVHFTVDRLLDADAVAKSEISEKLHGVYLPAVRDLTKQQRLDAADLLSTADMNKKQLTTEFMTKHGIDQKVQDFIKIHQELMMDALNKMNKVRESVGKKPIEAREAYSAFNATGDYRKVAHKTIDGIKTVVGIISANSRSGKFGWSLDKLEAEMLKRDPDLEFGPLQDMTQRKTTAEGTPNGAFQDALQTLGDNNPHIQDFLDVLKEVAKDDAKNYMGMQTHTMQKKGVWGMEGRKPWETAEGNMEAFFNNQVQYLEGVTRWSHLAEAAKSVNEVLRDQSVMDKHQNAIKLSEEYMQNAMGLNPSRFGKGVENVFNSLFSSNLVDAVGIGPSRVREALRLSKMGLNTSMLSLNPSFLGIQLIQGSTAMPAMTALLRGRGLAPKSTLLTGGWDYMAKSSMTLLKEMANGSKGLSTLETEALQFAKDKHIYATDMVEHANQISKGKAYYATWATQRPAALIEKSTRAQVYMAFVHMMDEAGLKKADGLFEQAHRMTDMAMNNYGALEKPAIYNALGPIGSMAYNLKSFGHNELSRWALFAREAKNNANYVPLLTQMATTIAVAGVMGLPFYSQWESIYDTITAKLGKPRSLTLDVLEASQELGKHVPQLGEYTLSNGAPTMLGADISKRVGLGDVIPSKASDVAFAGGSKGVDMVAKLGGVIAKPDEAHAKAAALAWAPPIAQSLLKEKWYTKGDLAYTMDPDKPPVATARLNERDKLLKKIGISGINESAQKEKYFQLNKLEKEYTDIRNKGLTRMAQDLYQGKPISEKAMQLYLRGQGDPSQIEAELTKMAMQQGVTQGQLRILKDGASRSLTKIYDLQRRTE